MEGDIKMETIQTAYEILKNKDFQNKDEILKMLKDNLEFVKVGSRVRLGKEIYILSRVRGNRDCPNCECVLINLETGNRWREPSYETIYNKGDGVYICKCDLDKMVTFTDYEIIK